MKIHSQLVKVKLISHWSEVEYLRLFSLFLEEDVMILDIRFSTSSQGTEDVCYSANILYREV